MANILEWNDSNEHATGPDGTEYAVQTENPHHEPKFSYLLIKRPGQDRYHRATSGRMRVENPDPWKETKKNARRWAELDARAHDG